MLKNIFCRPNFLLSTLATVAILASGANSVRAQTTPANYALFIAAGFLCDASDGGSCLAVAKSANGDSYEINGAGIFDPLHKSVKAAGTFNHRATSGHILETGVWTASDLVSFASYGQGSPALLPKSPAFGATPTGPRHSISSSRALPVGGLASFRVVLIPLSGSPKIAVLQVNCALGDVPRERSIEGIRVTFEKDKSEYLEEASGRVMFLVPASTVATVAKQPQQVIRSEEAETAQKW